MIKPATQMISESRFCAIDFESAGASRGRTDTPIQIGLAIGTVRAGVHRQESFTSYLKTHDPIQWSAQRIHGITTAELANAPTLPLLWPEIKCRMHGAVIVAHGKGTEKRFLRAFPGHGFGPWVDTLLLARAAWPDLPDHSLGNLCDTIDLTGTIRNLVPQKSWHDALFDAVASLVLLHHLIDMLAMQSYPVGHLIAPDQSPWRKLRPS